MNGFDTYILKLLESIELCLLPELESFDRCENHPEYEIRKNRLEHDFSLFIQLFRELDCKENLKLPSDIVSYLLILYKELQSEGPWNSDESKEYAQKLNCHFELLYDIPLTNVLKQNNVFNPQEIFERCFEKLNLKLVSNEYKKHPSLIEVYCSLIEHIENYDVTINPVKTLPISLLLIDDCITTSKIKGLRSCRTILQHLTPSDFLAGNYYEVVYVSLKKAFVEKDVEITRLVLDCFLELLSKIPSNVKAVKADDLYKNVLEQLYTEANLYRKANIFKFSKTLIQMHGVNCISRKSFKTIICDNIDICCNEAVEEILLQHVLECLEVWIQYYWCIWKLSTDHKILSILFKLLYVCKDDMVQKIQNITVSLISLCTEEERKQIFKSFENCLSKNKTFIERIHVVKKYISE